MIMKNWVLHLSIQYKLVSVLIATIAVAAIVLFVNIYSVLRLDQLNTALVDTFQRAEKSFLTQALLQNLRLTEKSFVIRGDAEKFREFSYRDRQLDALLFEAQAALEGDLLGRNKVSLDLEKNAFLALEQAKSAYKGLVEKVAAAAMQNDRLRALELAKLTDDPMAEMFTQVDTVNSLRKFALAQAAHQQRQFIILAIVVAAIALILFVVFAFAALKVIRVYLSQPLALLEQAIDAVEQGTFDPSALQEVADQPDEMGRMAHAFIEMAASAESRQAELRQRKEDIRLKLISQDVGR
jgi:methyl-accepting chemotaxis protein